MSRYFLHKQYNCQSMFKWLRRIIVVIAGLARRSLTWKKAGRSVAHFDFVHTFPEMQQLFAKKLVCALDGMMDVWDGRQTDKQSIKHSTCRRHMLIVKSAASQTRLFHYETDIERSMRASRVGFAYDSYDSRGDVWLRLLAWWHQLQSVRQQCYQKITKKFILL